MLLILGANGGVGSGLLHEASMKLPPEYGSVYGAMRPEWDLNDPESVDNFFANINRFDPRPDAPLYVINATGLLYNGVIAKVTDEEWERQANVGLRGTFRVARAFANAAKTRPGSSLLMISSVVPRLGIPGTGVYSMAKAAMPGLARSMSRELARNGSRVNVLEMGYFSTGIIDMVPPDLQEQIKAQTPLGRFGKVNELWRLADAIMTNTFVTGSTVTISGGL
jgi:NAD(P)-dependent dehydrogenase (short-subunit alcohol dehydrogenase family)